MFGEEQQGALLWLGLLVENINQYSPNKTINLEALQHAVRDHWRRGIFLLQQDRDIAGDYNKFVELLITRRASLPSEGDYLATNDRVKDRDIAGDYNKFVEHRRLGCRFLATQHLPDTLGCEKMQPNLRN